jgi:hypothetical protein
MLELGIDKCHAGNLFSDEEVGLNGTSASLVLGYRPL